MRSKVSACLAFSLWLSLWPRIRWKASEKFPLEKMRSNVFLFVSFCLWTTSSGKQTIKGSDACAAARTIRQAEIPPPATWDDYAQGFFDRWESSPADSEDEASSISSPATVGLMMVGVGVVFVCSLCFCLSGDSMGFLTLYPLRFSAYVVSVCVWRESFVLF